MHGPASGIPTHQIQPHQTQELSIYYTAAPLPYKSVQYKNKISSNIHQMCPLINFTFEENAS